MAKNVTGGIILLLGGSALIALAATDKGRYILDVLTNHTGPGSTASSSGQSQTSGGRDSTTGSGSTSTTGSGSSSGGFGGFGGSTSSGSVSSSPLLPGPDAKTKSVSDYSKLFGFVGEKGAVPV
jgi:hypothetical protein